MVYNGSTLKFYRNGFLMSQVNATGNLFQNDFNTRIGHYDYAFWLTQFLGYINEVRIWNTARSQLELKAFMNTSLPSPSTIPGLLGYYTFDNLLNKQGNPLFNGAINGSASINQTNPNCTFIVDSCAKIINTGGIGDIINSYTPVIALNSCSNKIIVEDASAFNIGDTVLLIQMKGAVIDSTNTASFGYITDYKNTGNYEFNYVKSKAGNIITLKDSVTRGFDLPAGKVQLIRVPYYNTANITSTLTCLPWDGGKGGVLVLNASDSVILNADIDVTGKGFSGGNSPNSGATVLNCFYNDYSYPLGSITAAAKGEGIALLGNNIAWGKGAAANGGGGGLGHNSGGGGGSNGGVGGLGGYQLEACGNAPFDNRGVGGNGLNYGTLQNKIFMGGGGGSGHVDNAGGSPMQGGNGGAIIIINALNIKANGYKIIAKGGDAPECTSPAYSNCHDGSGGGGGGGAILINNTNYITPVGLNVAGGKGADLTIFNESIGAGRIGPGGGGGAGITWLNKLSLPTNVSTVLAGGFNGVIFGDNNNPWGATPGQLGRNLYNLQIPISKNPFKKNIDSLHAKSIAVACNKFDLTGIAYTSKYPVSQWQWNFGDGNTANTQNTTYTYSIAGTYTVSLVITDINGCKDSTTISITTAGSGFDFSYKQDACNPLAVQFFNIGDSPVNPYWSFGDGTTVSGSANPSHVFTSTGNYPVKYAVQNSGCTDTITKNVSINITNQNIILTADTTICYGAAKQLITAPSLGFCWSPITYLSDPNNPNPITNTPVPITYYFTAEIPGNNLIINGDFNAGNTSFTSQYNFASPNITEGQYFVGSNPQSWNGGLSNCTDHTTANGNMLLVNGSPVPDVTVWNQTVPVTPNTNYAFSTWIQALYTPNPAQLSFSINGGDVGTLITAILPTCTWSRFYTTWNSGNSTAASISIVNKNTLVQGNDFALDDILFSPVLIKRDSVVIRIDHPVVKTNNDTLICGGNKVQLTATGAATYNWLPAAGLSNAAISNPIASNINTTQYIVTGTSVKGCSAADTVNIITKPQPIITKTPDTLICKNTNLQLLVTGGISYQWLPVNGLNNPATPNPLASPINSTTYSVIVTGANSCTTTDSIKITVRPTPIFTISSADTTCFNTAVQLAASGGDLYSWTPAALVSNANIANPNTTSNANTTYTVVIKERACNSTATLNTTVTVLPVPTIKASRSNDINCSEPNAQLSVMGAGQYEWSPAGSLSNGTIANPIASPATTTLYSVTGTDFVTNCTAKDTVTVFVNRGGASSFFIPSAFSPNGDGVNDCFKVKHFTYLKSVDISIYNRYGSLVFHTTTDNDCWDGTYKGSAAEPGNYVYYIKAKDNCEAFFKKGNLLLIR